MNTFESTPASLPQRSFSEVSATELQQVDGGALLIPALVVAAILLYSCPAK